MDRGAWWATVRGILRARFSQISESDMPEGLTHTPSPNSSEPKTISPLFSLIGLIDL